MKKSTKTTTSNKTQSTRAQRRSSSKAKPVTIDLKAEEVTEKAPKAATASTARNGTPKVKKSANVANEKTTATAASDTSAAKTEASKATAEAKDQTNFGRNASPAGGKSEKPAPSKAPSKDKKSSGGRAGLFAAALMGGVLALAGGYILQTAGLLPAPAQSDPAAIQQQVAAQTDALRTEIADLAARLDSASASSGTTLDSNALAAQVESILSERLAALPQGEGADMDTIITQVNETTLRVEKLIADQQANAKTLSDLQSAISAGEAGGGAAVSALALQVENSAASLSQLKENLAKLEADLAKVNDETSTQTATLTAELEDRLAGLERQAQSLPDMSAALTEALSAINANRDSITQQRQNVEALTASVNTPNSSEKLVAQAVAAAALKNDVDRGVPFESSLKILHNLSGEDASLSALTPFAQSGIPTIAQLSGSFASVSDAILAATEPAPDDNLSSRLLAGVKSFVKVKPRKELEGTTPIAIVSQISQALTDGDLSKASDLWNSLPEAGRNASSEWNSQLQSRITANDLISSTVQSFLNATATQ
ncbi:MAG: hypothetical protein MJH08_19005 [Hyphomicrobiales bacterium]|nr:hypothetical protein [Hyphomicrobiales bacterium]